MRLVEPQNTKESRQEKIRTGNGDLRTLLRGLLIQWTQSCFLTLLIFILLTLFQSNFLKMLWIYFIIWYNLMMFVSKECSNFVKCKGQIVLMFMTMHQVLYVNISVHRSAYSGELKLLLSSFNN